jgi:hypothetical protein
MFSVATAQMGLAGFAATGSGAIDCISSPLSLMRPDVSLGDLKSGAALGAGEFGHGGWLPASIHIASLARWDKIFQKVVSLVTVYMVHDQVVSIFVLVQRLPFKTLLTPVTWMRARPYGLVKKVAMLGNSSVPHGQWMPVHVGKDEVATPAGRHEASPRTKMSSPLGSQLTWTALKQVSANLTCQYYHTYTLAGELPWPMAQ